MFFDKGRTHSVFWMKHSCFRFLLTKGTNSVVFKRNILVSDLLLTKDANTPVFEWDVSDFCWQRMQTLRFLNEMFQIFVDKGCKHCDFWMKHSCFRFLLTKDANSPVFEWNIPVWDFFVFKGISTQRSSFLERTKQGHRQSGEHCKGFKAAIGDSSGKGVERVWAFPNS